MNGSSVPVQGEVFDITKAEGALAALRRVHMSTLAPEVKNQLRDAVFSVQNAALEADGKAVEALFTQHGLSVNVGAAPVMNEVPPMTENPASTSAANIATAPQTSAFGRPVPSFGQVAAPAPAPAAPESTPTPEQAMAAPSPAATTVPEPTSQPAVAPIAADPSTRIKEIKKEVNAMVGNPVNLIDTNAEVGREYMNALLDAMKKVNAGVVAADMERAMQRLEASFTAVKGLNLSESTAEPVPAETPAEPVTAEPALEPTESIQAEPTPIIPPVEATPTPVVKETPAEPVAAEPIPAPVTETETTPIAAEPVVSKIPVTSVSTPEAHIPSMADIAKAPEMTTPAPTEKTAEPVTPEPTETVPTAEPIKKSFFTAVAKEKQLGQIMKEQTETLEKAEGAKASAGDPLHDPAVTTGLEQLLSEWKLFKSSGIFGTGPSGEDHPLYKKLAPLTMAAVMTGRFEGSNTEIKQNLTEYMSGWRYEEGVVYEPAETFEHYLRRVIRHILDKQKK